MIVTDYVNAGGQIPKVTLTAPECAWARPDSGISKRHPLQERGLVWMACPLCRALLGVPALETGKNTPTKLERLLLGFVSPAKVSQALSISGLTLFLGVCCGVNRVLYRRGRERDAENGVSHDARLEAAFHCGPLTSF